jgi:hypothetical protein
MMGALVSSSCGLLLAACATAAQIVPLPEDLVVERKVPIDAGSLSTRFPVLSLGWTAAQLIAAWEAERASAALRVPFYMYGFAGNLSARAVVERYGQCRDALPSPSGRFFKKAGEIFWLQQLIDHPWRVREPAAAALLVMPIALSMDMLCETKQLSAQLLERVRAGELWTSRLHDHVYLSMGAIRAAALPGMPGALWVGYLAGRARLPGHPWLPSLVGEYADVAEPISEPTWPKSLEFAFVGQTHSNYYQKGYYTRMAMREQMPALFAHDGRGARASWPSLVFVDSSSKPHCLPKCARTTDWSSVQFEACQGWAPDTLLSRRATFTLFVRGDTPTTDRLVRAVQTSSIAIVASDLLFQTALPGQCLIPYEHILEHVREKAFQCELPEALQHVRRAWPPERLARARLLMRHFARDILWHAPDSRVAENLLLEIARYRRRGVPGQKPPHGALPRTIPCGFNNYMRHTVESALDALRLSHRYTYNFSTHCGPDKVHSGIFMRDMSTKKMLRAHGSTCQTPVSRAWYDKETTRHSK